MDTQVTAGSTEQATSQEVDTVKINRQIIQRLQDVHFLLNTAYLPGKYSELAVVSKQFLIDFKNHIEAQIKQAETR